MKVTHFVGVAAVGILSLAALMPALNPPRAEAQISLNFGVEPVCPYGYYDYAPYRCSPYGYYGPEWFNGGGFIGAGRWHRGGEGFVGNVDNRYDPRRGYRGPYPEHNDQRFNHFHGNEQRDGHGRHQGGHR
jgi:hypothetical protein